MAQGEERAATRTTDEPSGYRSELLMGRARLGIWGVGHIGYSSMCHFAERGVKVVGVDVDAHKVATINEGENPIFAMDYWLGFTPKYLFDSGAASATTEWRDLIQGDVLVHLVCIPTERDGKPYFDILEEVCNKIAELGALNLERPPLVIVESTLAPNTTDNVITPIFEARGLAVGKDILLGCAPRRDWFATPDKSLRTLPRIIGGTDERTTQAMRDVLGIICENLIPAPDHHHAEVVKSIENAYRHMEITLANELALAYPELDMRTVLKLVGTKWNVEEFHPSFGVGGYCIPLASYYVVQGASRPEFLNLLETTIASSEAQPKRVAEYLINRGDVKKVGILGLSYTSNVKVESQSPTLTLVRMLVDQGIEVQVNDPHYSELEVKRICGVDSFAFPEDLDRFDTVLLVAGHREYESCTHARLLECLFNCRLVLDNAALWKAIDFAGGGIEYHLAGEKNWLGTLNGRVEPR